MPRRINKRGTQDHRPIQGSPLKNEIKVDDLIQDELETMSLMSMMELEMLLEREQKRYNVLKLLCLLPETENMTSALEKNQDGNNGTDVTQTNASHTDENSDRASITSEVSARSDESNESTAVNAGSPKSVSSNDSGDDYAVIEDDEPTVSYFLDDGEGLEYEEYSFL